MAASLSLYQRIVQNRPFKLDSNEVEYREADSELSCSNCLHFYKRSIDGYKVCEIFRDGEGEDEEPIKDDWVCSFHTVDGEDFPLLKSTDKTSVPRHED
jgi:hypothetical protein